MINGTIDDFRLEKYLGDLQLELQQKTSKTMNIVTHIPGEGYKMHETIQGVMGAYEKNQRFQDKQIQDGAFSRVIYQYTVAASDYGIDKVDQLNSAGDLLAPALEAQKAALARKIDLITINAIKGSMLRTENGVTSSVALPGTSKIAVGDNSFTHDNETGDTPLTDGKLAHALTLLEDAEIDTSAEEIIVLGSYRQIQNLAKYVRTTSQDFVSKRPLEIPGLVPGLQGYRGCTFVACNLVGNIVGGVKNAVYVFPKSNIRKAVRIPLHTTQNLDTNKTLHPLIISSATDLAVVRLHDAGVIEIACEPLT